MSQDWGLIGFCDGKWKSNCKRVRRSDFTVNNQTGPTDNFPPRSLGGATGARLLAPFPFCWGQFQLYRGAFPAHPASPGALICAAMWVFFSWWGVTSCEKRCLEACFLKSLRRLIKKKSYKWIKRGLRLSKGVHVRSLSGSALWWRLLLNKCVNPFVCNSLRSQLVTRPWPRLDGR